MPGNGRVLSAPNASCGSADRHIADAAAGGPERLMGREGAFANVGLQSRSDQMLSARFRQRKSRVVVPHRSKRGGRVELCCVCCIVVRRSQRVAQRALRWSSEEEVSVEVKVCDI